MSEQQPREVGMAMWAGARPPGSPSRLRPAPEPEQAAEGRTVDVRDAIALAMLLSGLVGAVATAAHWGGWWGVLALLSVALVSGGVTVGLR